MSLLLAAEYILIHTRQWIGNCYFASATMIVRKYLSAVVAYLFTKLTNPKPLFSPVSLSTAMYMRDIGPQVWKSSCTKWTVFRVQNWVSMQVPHLSVACMLTQRSISQPGQTKPNVPEIQLYTLRLYELLWNWLTTTFQVTFRKGA